MKDWLRRHPEVAGALCAAIVASLVADMFAIGVRLGEVRALQGEADRIVSESLGG